MSDLNPDPDVWPACEHCGTAYVLRRTMSLSKGWTWVWQQDCIKRRSTCKGAQPFVRDANGRLGGSPDE